MKKFRSEDELTAFIRRSSRSPKSPFGIGDDAALIHSKKGQVITTDFLVEEVDFKKGTDFKRVARKALAVNLSDLAAMGARPTKALLYVGFPGEPTLKVWKRILAGWNGLARKYGVELIGGDLSRAKQWMIGAVLIGEMKNKKVFERRGARVGDSLWVTGRLGGSILGRHFSFEPRVKEAFFLARSFKISSCIDLSDGLGRDLPRLLQASGRGAKLRVDQIPVSKDAVRLSRQTKSLPLAHAFRDGEDFELLFTLPRKSDGALLKKWKSRFRTPLTKIGEITKTAGIECVSAGEKKWILPPSYFEGFDHFAKK